MKRAGNLFPRITEFENLHRAFKKAFKGANRTEESLAYFFNLEKNLLALKEDLEGKTYQPGAYQYFKVFDPKERVIAVAPFRDRVVHHAIVNILEPLYEKSFIFDSYATRKEKGTHKAIERAQGFLRNNRWFLKADVEKYFDSIDHQVLLSLLKRKIKDPDLVWLLEGIIQNGGDNGRGLPIGNLTSQFLANVYLDPFDHFVKEELKVHFYLRYMDDFVVFDREKEKVKSWRSAMEGFLETRLKLRLNKKVVLINQSCHGLSFLGSRIFPNLVRIKRESLQRCLKKTRQKLWDYGEGRLSEEGLKQSLSSIIGHIGFFDSWELRKTIFNGQVS